MNGVNDFNLSRYFLASSNEIFYIQEFLSKHFPLTTFNVCRSKYAIQGLFIVFEIC